MRKSFSFGQITTHSGGRHKVGAYGAGRTKSVACEGMLDRMDRIFQDLQDESCKS